MSWSVKDCYIITHMLIIIPVSLSHIKLQNSLRKANTFWFMVSVYFSLYASDRIFALFIMMRKWCRDHMSNQEIDYFSQLGPTSQRFHDLLNKFFPAVNNHLTLTLCEYFRLTPRQYLWWGWSRMKHLEPYRHCGVLLGEEEHCVPACCCHHWFVYLMLSPQEEEQQWMTPAVLCQPNVDKFKKARTLTISRLSMSKIIQVDLTLTGETWSRYKSIVYYLKQHSCVNISFKCYPMP